MTRVVQRDHRTEELGDLDGHGGEGCGGGTRAEDLGVAACVMDIVVRRQCPVTGTSGKACHFHDIEEGNRRLASQRRERPVTSVVVPFPELERPEIDLPEWDIGRRHAVASTRDTRLSDYCGHIQPSRQWSLALPTG